MQHSRVLFIARKSDYNFTGGYPHRTTGLRISAGLCVRVLNDHGIPAKLVVVNDNNDIDREVTAYQPTHVIIEALWVVPSKFAVLIPLHSQVKWIIRLHSEVPFMALEGPSTEWIVEYIKFPQVFVSGNSPNLDTALDYIILAATHDAKIAQTKNIFLPNCYPPLPVPARVPFADGRLHVGCFGAIRPLKNQLIQALAAITYADRQSKALVFHMNGFRVEQGGDPILKNIRNLFNNAPQHQLVLHDWLEHDDFLKLVSQMHVGLQVSLSESFNIVSADFVSCRVPIVVSPEVYWLPGVVKARPTDIDGIIGKIGFVVGMERWFLTNLCASYLNRQNNNSTKVWISEFA